jgi:DNA-binding MarR family transcriptional regulator
MAMLRDEHLRALRFLARRPRYGYKEATLLEKGFTTGQLGHLVYAGLAKLRRGVGRPSVLRVKITAAGRRAIAE